MALDFSIYSSCGQLIIMRPFHSYYVYVFVHLFLCFELFLLPKVVLVCLTFFLLVDDFTVRRKNGFAAFINHQPNLDMVVSMEVLQ